MEVWPIVQESIPFLLQGLWQVTLPLTGAAFVCGLIIGTIVALIRLSRSRGIGVRILQKICIAYVWIIRGTPELVFLFVIFFGLPNIGIKLDQWTTAIIAFSLNAGAFISEGIRGAITSIPKGQLEAADVIGLNRRDQFRYVLFPQSIRVALPMLVNDLIGILKGTSLVSTIAMTDMFFAAQTIAGRNFQPMILYVTAAVIYIAICSLLTVIQSQLEKASSTYVEAA